jgi:hypothetical protein
MGMANISFSQDEKNFKETAKELQLEIYLRISRKRFRRQVSSTLCTCLYVAPDFSASRLCRNGPGEHPWK